jgi:hypothetical protein
MGFGTKKRQVREAIAKWECFGYLGYGQGRCVAQFGEGYVGNRSACMDICTRASACRAEHLNKMNERYPQLAVLVKNTAGIAEARHLDIVAEVVSAMNHAVELGLDEAVEVKRILGVFKIDTMTDHFRCGQFENIQDGLNKVPPGSRSAVAGLLAKAS